jgi:hypothetical protein
MLILLSKNVSDDMLESKMPGWALLQSSTIQLRNAHFTNAFLGRSSMRVIQDGVCMYDEWVNYNDFKHILQVLS